MATAKITTNEIVFNPDYFSNAKDQKGLIAALGKIVDGALPDKAVFMHLTEAAIKSGQMDKASKAKEPTSVKAIVADFRERMGKLPGRKAYANTTLDPMVSVYNKFALAGFTDQLDKAEFAVRNFKGAFTERAALLGKLLDQQFAANDAESQQKEMADWLEAETAKKASLKKALARLAKTLADIEKEHGDAMKMQKAVRDMWVIGMSNLVDCASKVQDEVKDGQSTIADELAAIRARATNGVVI